MIDKAAQWYKQYGREKTLAQITRAGTEKRGEFIDRDLYIFAYDLARDGGKVPVLFSASAMVDSLNRVQGIVCVAHDITERKHTEANLKNYSLELEAANTELKNITNIFFHDLRTPLVNVKGFSSELQTTLKALIEIQGAGGPADQERVRRHRELEREVMESLRFIDYSVNKEEVL